MLAAFRAMAKSWVAVVLFGLLIVAFAVWGVNDSFKAKLSNDVIRAGEHRVSMPRFKAIFDNVLKGVSQENGGVQITALEAAKNGLVDRLIVQLSEDNALWEMIRRIGVSATDPQLAEALSENRAFFDPISGKFDQNTYRTLLAQNGIQPEEFEGELKDGIAEAQFSAGLGAGLQAPDIYLATLAASALQTRDAEYFVVAPDSVPPPAKPTDAQLQAFIQENAERLRRPEFRTISLVRFSAAAMSGDTPIDEAKARQLFEANQARYAIPERRSFVQIPARDPAMANAMAARLNKGEDPASVAAAFGSRPIEYKDAQQAAAADPQAAAVAFRLNAGQTSGPVQSQFGVSVVKVLSVTPGKPATFESARPEIVKELQAQAAQEKVYAAVQKYEEAHDSGGSLADAAKAAGVKVYDLGPLTADGRDRMGRQVVGLNAQMLRETFAQPKGGESEVADLGKGEYYALRVNEIQPAALPKVDEVRAQLTAAYMQRELVRALRAKADALAARLQKGEAMAAVAASVNAKVEKVSGVSRLTAQQQQALGSDLVGGILAAKPNAAFVAQAPRPGFAVAKITRIQQPNPRMAAALTLAQRGRISVALGSEMRDTLRTYAKERIKPKVDRKNALSAVNVSEQDLATAPAAK